MKPLRNRKNRKKAMSVERLEARQLFSAVPPHHAAVHDMAGTLPDITVSSLSQFQAADFAHKAYDKVTIDNATGWFGHGKSFRFDGFDSLTIQGDLKDAKLSIASGSLPDDIRVTKSLQDSSINAAGSLGTVSVDGSITLDGSKIDSAKGIEGLTAKGTVTLIDSTVQASDGRIGTIQAGKDLWSEKSRIEGTAIGRIEAGSTLGVMGGEVSGRSGVGQIEAGQTILWGGALHSKGSVTLTAPDVVIGKTGTVAAKEILIASTANQVSAPGSIVNDGSLRASGAIDLTAPRIDNAGKIVSTRGDVTVGAPALMGTVKAGTLPPGSFIENSGTIQGRDVTLVSAGGNPDALAIDSTGSIRAIGGKGSGVLTLRADANGIQSSGTLEARSGDRGGIILLDGHSVALWDKAKVDLSGANGGGRLTLKGSELVVGPSVRIDASATGSGKGGTIRLLGKNTSFDGTLVAQGGPGGGDGGSLTLNGSQSVTFGGKADLDAGLWGNGGSVRVSSKGPVSLNGDLSATGGTLSGNGGTVSVRAGVELTTAGVIDLSAGAMGNGGSLRLRSTGENSFEALLLADGGSFLGNGGSMEMKSGWIGTDFTGEALLNARGLGNGGSFHGTTTGETAFIGTVEADGGSQGGNGGSFVYHGTKVFYEMGTIQLLAPAGIAGTPTLDVPRVSHDLFSPPSPNGSPITHVIMIYGENRSFNNLFATYLPRQGQSVQNFLSEGIINPNGTPGPNFSSAAQSTAVDTGTYQTSPTITGTYATLPQPYSSNYTTPDTRFPTNLPNGVFQISKWAPYNTKTGDPIHTYFTELQQADGGTNKLYTWVGQTFSKTPEGGVSMGFYNVLAGNGSFLNYLGQAYAMGDNFHQTTFGATAPNTLGWVTGGVPLHYTAANGEPATPPAGQIQNPNPVPGTNNQYINDGAAYINLSDPSQPGVAAARASMNPLFQNGDVKNGYYYMLTDYHPGYNMNGTPRPLGPTDSNVPPSNTPSIFQDLTNHGVSWTWFAQSKNTDPSAVSLHRQAPLYFQYIMDSSQKNNIQGMTQFYQQAASDSLPAVSFVRPNAAHDGHPASSTPAALQNFVQNVVEHVQANKKLWYSSEINFTVDSTGGYYQPGHNQALTYFGDGGSIPFLTISPYVSPGTVHHTYADTVSTDKLIENNWKLPPIASDTLDNLPNPLPNPSNPYLPPNQPAISDLSGYFTSSPASMGKAASLADPTGTFGPAGDSGTVRGNNASDLVSSSQGLAGSVIGTSRSLSSKDLAALSVVGA